MCDKASGWVRLPQILVSLGAHARFRLRKDAESQDETTGLEILGFREGQREGRSRFRCANGSRECYPRDGTGNQPRSSRYRSQAEQGSTGTQRVRVRRRLVDCSLRIGAHVFHAVCDRPDLPGPQASYSEGSEQRSSVADFSLSFGAFHSGVACGDSEGDPERKGRQNRVFDGAGRSGRCRCCRSHKRKNRAVASRKQEWTVLLGLRAGVIA